jgi:hypothetical protein
MAGNLPSAVLPAGLGHHARDLAPNIFEISQLTDMLFPRLDHAIGNQRLRNVIQHKRMFRKPLPASPQPAGATLVLP